MDIRQLRYFVVVAEELHFSRAAVRLHMSQPPLSQQIKALEEELGVTLLVRNKREVKLTDAGEVFLEECRRLIEQLQSAIDVTVRAAGGDTGVLRVGVSTSAVFHVMPEVLGRLRTHFPEIELVVRDMGSSDQIRAVSKDRLDIGIIHESLNVESLQYIPLFSDPFVLAVPEAHPLAGQAAVRLADLRNERFISFSREAAPSLYDSLILACSKSGFEPKIAHTARHALTIFQMVRLELGIAFVPQSFAHSQTPGVCYVQLDPVPQGVRIGAIWNPKTPSALVQNVVQTILSRPFM